MMIETVIAIVAILGITFYVADQLDIWERESMRWSRRQQMREQTHEEMERVNYLSDLM